MPFFGAGFFGGGGGGAFTPAGLSGLVWWAEANNADNKSSNAGTGTVSDGTAVGYLADKSVIGNHFLSFADDTTRPTFRSTAGGSPRIQFDGSNDALARVANIGLFDAIGSAVFIAVRGNSPAANSVMFGEVAADGSGSSALFHYLRRHGTTANMSDVFARNDASNAMIVNGNLNAADAFLNDKVVGIVDTGTNAKVYVDGTEIDSFNYTRTGTSTFGQVLLGANRSPATPVNNSWFAGYFHAGVAMTDVPDATAITNITTYLGALQGRSI